MNIHEIICNYANNRDITEMVTPNYTPGAIALTPGAIVSQVSSIARENKIKRSRSESPLFVLDNPRMSYCSVMKLRYSLYRNFHFYSRSTISTIR